SHTNHAEGLDAPEKALETQRAYFYALDQILEGPRDARRHEDLSALRLAAEPRGQVGDRADGAVVPAPLEADGADRRVSLGDPDAQGQVVTPLAPSGGEIADALAHGDSHAERALGRVRHRHRVVEEDHHAIAR